MERVYSYNQEPTRGWLPWGGLQSLSYTKSLASHKVINLLMYTSLTLPHTWSGWWMTSEICLASSRKYESLVPCVSRVTGSSIPRLSRYDRNFCVCHHHHRTTDKLEIIVAYGKPLHKYLHPVVKLYKNEWVIAPLPSLSRPVPSLPPLLWSSPWKPARGLGSCKLPSEIWVKIRPQTHFGVLWAWKSYLAAFFTNDLRKKQLYRQEVSEWCSSVQKVAEHRSGSI